jgi:hypothetical protein
MDKYLLYNPDDGYETFESLEMLKNYFNELDLTDEEIPNECFKIYKLIEISSLKETDNISNYKCVKNHDHSCYNKDSCDDEDEGCEDAEEWPYNSDIETIVEIEWINVQ